MTKEEAIDTIEKIRKQKTLCPIRTRCLDLCKNNCNFYIDENKAKDALEVAETQLKKSLNLAPAIPLDWIEEHCNDLRVYSDFFTTAYLAGIQSMIERWKNENDGY